MDIYRSKKLNELTKILEQRKEKAIKQEKEIEDFIKSIDNSSLRQIFEFKYIDGFSWVQIQLFMGYKHEDTARKKHDRYLIKIEKSKKIEKK